MKTTQQRNNATTQILFSRFNIFIVLFVFVALANNLTAQNALPQVHYYYVEEVTPNLMTPLTKNRLADHSLDISFTNQEFDEFFSQKTVYVFKKAFPGAINKRLQNMYLIGLSQDDVVDDFRNLSNVVYADFIGDIDSEPLSTPVDYESDALIPTQVLGGISIFGLPKEHLDLVNAKQAWHITTGNTNVAIGIVDQDFYPTHPELINKTLTHYGSIWSGNTTHPHGVKVAGIAAGDTNSLNGVGLASIGYDTSMITLRRGDSNFIPGSPHPFDEAYTSAQNKLFLVQTHPNIKVINYSMKQGCSYIEANALVYQEIWNQYGVTTVAAAGNGEWHTSCDDSQGDNAYLYPASYDHVISVSSVSSLYPYGTEDEDNNKFGWKDVHQFIINNLTYVHTHNDKVDIVAPGHAVPTTNEYDDYATGFGTSFASPMVAGVAALMYAINPTITPDEVRSILMQTAENIYHIPENQPYVGLLGTGRLNAYAAVLQAKCLANPTAGLDLMMQNSDDDFGVEPDVNTDVIWDSPDIWVRNQDDGILYQTSEDLHFVDNQTPVYVYVKVTNNSCETSTGNEILELYWAKGGLSQQWPNVWQGNVNLDPNTPIGNPVNQNPQNPLLPAYIPSLAPGESTILEFPWQPLDPDAYANLGFEKPWMFCFLSKIVASTTTGPMADPLEVIEGSNAALNTRNNNNIAYKNATVINVANQPDSGSIVVGNVGNSTSITSDIEFFTNTIDDDNVWQDAEVRVELNQDLWNLWQNSGGQFSDVRVIDPIQRIIQLTANNASLNNIAMPSDVWGVATLGVNFLVNQVGAQEDYRIHVQQLESTTQEVLGGFSYTFFRDNQRQNFNAGTNRVSNSDGSETFYVEDINEEAIYNWYDEDGILIYSGSDFTISNMIAQEYKLEVIAETDGHKDYKTVETEDKRVIESISPNPATTSTIVSYQVATGDNAYVRLTHSVSGVFYNYILDSQNSSLTIPTQNLAQGTYVVNLIANGTILDAKQLIIN
jgi:hypothetical protein